MDTKPLCPSCGKPLDSNAPGGLCPECLMKGAFPTGTDNGGKSPRFVPPTVGEISALFPQLEILDLIGQGGMGAVYKARQKQLGRVVALKILPPGIGSDPAFAERFTREARALAQLNHPGIVTLYEFGETSGQFYFLMEFVDGVNLRQLLQAGRMSAREALAIVPQICDALQFAHDQGIVHRDIKPENILLDRRGRVKVADFGLAKLVGAGNEPMAEGAAAAGSPILTGSGKIMGTPNYMAPEQKEYPDTVDHRADIYALGVVFYQMLTGELPGKKLEPPSRKVQIDVRLDEVVMRALEKKPELRYQQAGEVKTQVETIVATPPGSSPCGEAQTENIEKEISLKKKSWLVSPLSSPDAREIAAHLTKEERGEAALYGLLWGIWVVTATFGNLFLIKSFPAPGSWIVASIIVALFIASTSPMLRIQRRFLCSTAWAKERGYKAEKLKLFSFGRRNLWKIVIFAVAITLFAIVQIRLINHLSGVSELAASLKEDAERTKELSAQLADHIKSDYIGQAYFPHGDSIEITSVERSENQMIVKGHYNLISADEASLSLNITATNDFYPVDDPVQALHRNQSLHISRGRGDFELSRDHLEPGLPHVSMYANDHAFAGVYFGTKPEALAESTLDLTDHSTVSFGPVVETVVEPGGNLEGYDLNSGRVMKIGDLEHPGANLVVRQTSEGSLAMFFVGTRAELFPDGEARWNMAGWIVATNLAIIPESPDAFTNVYGLSWHQAQVPAPSTDPENYQPDTYEFQTLEGRLGVLQILGFTENPPGVKIRYKLVEDEPNRTTLPSASTVTSVPIPLSTASVGADYTVAASNSAPSSYRWLPETNSTDSAETWSPTPGPGEKLDFSKILQEADDLMNQGRYEESLQHLLWYFKHSRNDPGQAGVRISFALSDWIELGRRYPKARQALLEIRDHDTREFAEGRGYFDLFMELSNINSQLQDDDATVALFKSIEHDKQLAQQCFIMAEGALVQRGDYELCMNYIDDPLAAFENIHQEWIRMKQMEDQQAVMRQQETERFQAMAKTNALYARLAMFPPSGPPKMADKNFIGQTRQLIEVLVGVGRTDEADKIQQEAVAVLDVSDLKSAVSDAQQRVKERRGNLGTITN